jgi:hypothetical protein
MKRTLLHTLISTVLVSCLQALVFACGSSSSPAQINSSPSAGGDSADTKENSVKENSHPAGTGGAGTGGTENQNKESCKNPTTAKNALCCARTASARLCPDPKYTDGFVSEPDFDSCLPAQVNSLSDKAINLFANCDDEPAHPCSGITSVATRCEGSVYKSIEISDAARSVESLCENSRCLISFDCRVVRLLNSEALTAFEACFRDGSCADKEMDFEACVEQFSLEKLLPFLRLG